MSSENSKTNLRATIESALDAASRSVAILEMGKRAITDLDRLTAREAVKAFLLSLPEGTTIAVADPSERRIRLAKEIADAL